MFQLDRKLHLEAGLLHVSSDSSISSLCEQPNVRTLPHTSLESDCARLNNVSKIHVYPEPQNMTLFGEKVSADIIN